MNIVYYLDKDDPKYWQMLFMSAHSVYKNVAFPHFVLQTTDEIRDKYDTAMAKIPAGWPMIHSFLSFNQSINTHWPYWYRRIKMNTMMRNTQCLFLDIDTLVLGDISDIFQYYHSKIIATIRYPYQSNMPRLNWGVYFGQNDDFWEDMAQEVSHTSKDPERDIGLFYNRKLHTNEDSYSVVSGELFNRNINGYEEIKDISNSVKILHFKGQRKQYMEYYYNKLILGKEGDIGTDKQDDSNNTQTL